MTSKCPTKISIITPTLNQGRFIETTIKSVLHQNYPNLEYIVIDGGSTDGTLDILKKYQNQLHWISEKDNGQVDAINKGLNLISGDIVTYINSDDLYFPKTFNKVEGIFASSKDIKIITGKCMNIDIAGNETRPVIKMYKNLWMRLNNDNLLKIANYISQPATFWRRELIETIGFFNPLYRYGMDYDYWLRISKEYKIHYVDDYLAYFRIYPSSITSSNSKKQFEEEYKIASTYANNFYLFLHKIHARFAYLLYKNYLNKIVRDNEY